MSENSDTQPDDASGISDEQLPEDLQPGEDNPLAEPLDPDDEATKDPDELGMHDTQDDLGNPPGDSARTTPRTDPAPSACQPDRSTSSA